MKDRREILVVFYWGKHPLARLIQFGMFLYQILRGKKPIKSPNHTEILIRGIDNQFAYSYGARASGVFPLPLEKTANLGKRKGFKIPVDEETYKKVLSYCIQTTGAKYEFSNFKYQIRKIFTGKWGGQDKPKKFYCIEHTSHVLNIIKPGFIEEPRSMNPFDLYEKLK